ncbi:MAG TPA: hypothetical protein VFA81_10320 [Burkholderiales bacterium]|nr:hypothetical protein [Burkholderiales bacterium]
MNVRTIALAITLIVPPAAALAAKGVPYTGPDRPVMTTASNDVVTHEVYGWGNIPGKDTAPAMQYAPTVKASEAVAKDKVLTASKDAPINTPTAN